MKPIVLAVLTGILLYGNLMALVPQPHAQELHLYSGGQLEVSVNGAPYIPIECLGNSTCIDDGVVSTIGQLAVQETHDPTFCTTENKDKAHRCDCVMQDPSGCKDGKRDIEMAMCLAYCDKAMCHCCAS